MGDSILDKWDQNFQTFTTPYISMGQRPASSMTITCAVEAGRDNAHLKKEDMSD
jgi:hypothetical protein